ncbi:hypothetical protein BDV34DRAFT_231715 [Aspergillus parasiticus]|uniref:Uncharacterized protein n=1 Tax=Aspergillus parasiticus TaxID=5067 RepID=A0A5N6D0Y3_ASPPA|nr:hypothetical protein BDV34DRAFT_231715 [Aspergillus parasiticus]
MLKKTPATYPPPHVRAYPTTADHLSFPAMLTLILYTQNAVILYSLLKTYRTPAGWRNDLYTYGWVNKTIQNELGTVTFWVVLANDFMTDDL